ncbi:MAG: hypothetical protein AMXMBFR13_18620 [Phycisphaerae bacterium]
MRSYDKMITPGRHWIRGLVWVPLLCTGCVSAWWNSFLDPSAVGNYRDSEVIEIQSSISLRDQPAGVPGAADPIPEDLVAYVEEYRIGPGDALVIRLLDFLQLGAETELTLIVDELGSINMPQLGLIHIEGLSAPEAQQEIIEQAKAAGIYLEEDKPAVTVQVVGAQQRLFHVGGSVPQPGSYTIPRPDFRLREAINLAGGLDPSIKTVYVQRNAPRQKKVRERSLLPEPAPADLLPADAPLPAGPPVTPVTLAELGQGGGQQPNPVTEPGSSIALPPDQAERELIEAVAPGTNQPSERSTQAPQTPVGTETPPATSMPTWIYVNDRFVEVRPTTPATAPADPAAPTVQDEPTPALPAIHGPEAEPVEWEELADGAEQRIIRIPAEKLRNGETNYDLVIRHQDWIRVDPGPVGVFYLTGQVQRPGTYNFVGEQITLRQAIASAGGLGPLAWPTRCSITRRIDENREELLQLDLARILEAKDPDFYLKPNDLIDVGTHAIAPLLLTIRNSLRLTYGFGFVYDRNFADMDAYFPQQNPRERRRALLSQRFPGLFP